MATLNELRSVAHEQIDMLRKANTPDNGIAFLLNDWLKNLEIAELATATLVGELRRELQIDYPEFDISYV